MSRAVVTGGAGFIGSHLVDALLALGDEVWVIDNFNDYYHPGIKRSNIAHHYDGARFHLVEGDICDQGLVSRLFSEARPEIVFHLAARAGVRPSLKLPHLYAKVNIEGSMNILEAARKSGCARNVLISSSSVYGRQNSVPYTEEQQVFPVSPYAVTKRAMELFAFSYHKLWKLPLVCLRLFNVYGERGRPDNIPAMFTVLALEGKPIPRFGDGETQRDYTYVGDIVDGILRCHEIDFSYEIINLGNHQPVSLNDFISTIQSIVQKPLEIQELPPHPADVDITFAGVEKAKRLLDWQPRTTLAEGLTRYHRWLLDHPELRQLITQSIPLAEVPGAA